MTNVKVNGTRIDDVEVFLPDLGVTVTVSGQELILLAQRAHRNKSKRSKSGPCQARATGRRPDSFQNRFSVHYECSNGHGSGTAAHDAYLGDAEEVYATFLAREDDYSYVELRGPTSHEDDELAVLKSRGTKRRRRR